MISHQLHVHGRGVCKAALDFAPTLSEGSGCREDSAVGWLVAVRGGLRAPGAGTSSRSALCRGLSWAAEAGWLAALPALEWDGSGSHHLR